MESPYPKERLVLTRSIEKVTFRILVEGNVTQGNLLGDAGLSVLVDVIYDDKTKLRLLFDTGAGTPALMHNVHQLKVDLSSVDMIVLSHGHWDHVGGLKEVLKITGKIPILYHPKAIEPKIYIPEGEKERDVGIKNYITPQDLKDSAEVIEAIEPYNIGDGIWTTGEVPRTNDFEILTGPLKKIHVIQDGQRVMDPVDDDLSLIFKLKDGSVVLLAGCCHAGIVNTLKHVTKLTGTTSVKAVVGGLHLFDASKERLSKTIEHLKDYPLETLSPCHCSGLRGKAALMYGFEDIFKDVGPGSTLEFTSN